MADSLATPALAGFRDLVPWGDPYIVGLLRKLQRQSGAALSEDWPDTNPRDEAPPPLLEPDLDALPPRSRGAAWPRRD